MIDGHTHCDVMEVLVSLAKALSRLPQDTATEIAVRDVLALLLGHRETWLTAGEIGARSGHAIEAVSPILESLAQGYVVRVDGAQPPAYRFDGDIGVALEIDSFVRRVRAEHVHAQANVARFRRRYGGNQEDARRS